MRPLSGILVSLVRANPGREPTYIIINPAHAYLQEFLRRAFEGREDVRLIVDRRFGERRTTPRQVAVERRHADRRRPRAHIVEVILAEESPGGEPPRQGRPSDG